MLGQCNSWLKDGLRPRAHDARPGLGRAGAASQRGGQGALRLAGRPSATSAPQSNGLRTGGRTGEPWWKDQDTRLVHFIGKDNIVFHCIIFPILLKQHGGFLLPQNVPANEFLNLEGQQAEHQPQLGGVGARVPGTLARSSG